MNDLFDKNMNGADFSTDRNYRWKLWRTWDESLPRVMCIGLNPSTANEHKNDNTINILTAVLSRLGYGGFYMMNCFAYITSNPKLLKHNPMSDEWNNNVLTITASKCQDIIFCWGTFEIVTELGRDKELIEMFPRAKCFGKNKNGTPCHPRALSYAGTLDTATLQPYS